MNKTMIKTVLAAVAAVAILNRTSQGKALVSGDQKFLGIF